MVVSNSSTLIHLSAIGRLVLLKDFYGQIIIPPAVWKEVVEEGEAGFWIREDLYRQALEAVGEHLVD